jgi:hypothetical protein
VSNANADKRRNARVNCLYRIGYRLNDITTEELLHAHILNISESGMCIFTTNVLSEGDRITIKNRLPNSYYIGNVCWVKKFGSNLFKSGVMFLSDRINSRSFLNL